MKSARFDTLAFYGALDAVRQDRELHWNRVALESGLSASTLTRMRQGKRPDVDGLAALCVWSGLSADRYIRTDPSGEPRRAE
jgi:transcriptional regulator with XRE-family HTH domain